MLWSKPSWLSRDGKVGLEVIYSEEPPYREVTHLTTWKTDTMHTHDSFWPTGYKHERGQPWRGLGYCECVGGWGRGCEEPRLHFLHSHLFPVDTHVYTYPGPEVGTNNQKRVTLRVAFLNWFLSHAKSQSHPGSLILPLRFFFLRLFPTFSSLSTRLAPPAQNFRVTVSVLVLSEDKGPTFIFGFEHSVPNISSM